MNILPVVTGFASSQLLEFYAGFRKGPVYQFFMMDDLNNMLPSCGVTLMKYMPAGNCFTSLITFAVASLLTETRFFETTLLPCMSLIPMVAFCALVATRSSCTWLYKRVGINFAFTASVNSPLLYWRKYNGHQGQPVWYGSNLPALLYNQCCCNFGAAAAVSCRLYWIPTSWAHPNFLCDRNGSCSFLCMSAI